MTGSADIPWQASLNTMPTKSSVFAPKVSQSPFCMPIRGPDCSPFDIQDEVTKQRARPPYGLSSHSVGVSHTGPLPHSTGKLIVDVRGLFSAPFHSPRLFGVDVLTIITPAPSPHNYPSP